MKSARTYIIVLVGALVFGCNKETPKDCSISTTTFTTPDGGNLSYSVTISGGGTIKSVTYMDATGPVLVDNPATPFQVSFSVATGTLVGISAVGSINKGGSMMAGYLFFDSKGINPVNTATSCEN